MQIYGEIAKVEPQEDGTIKVYGFASAPVRDAHGEIVSTGAMQKAIDGYMKYPAVREMHDATKAAGRAIDIGVDDEGKTSFAAHVVDPIAVKKVQTQTYAGFSIGGRVKKRNDADPTIIDEIDLIEVSLVDRPSCPAAGITLWKAEGIEVEDDVTKIAGSEGQGDDYAASVDDVGPDLEKRKWNAKERREAASSGEALPDGSYPIKDKEDLHDAIQAYGRAKDKAKAKAHIKARARALGATGMLPDDWKTAADDSVKTEEECTKETPAEAEDVQKVAARTDELLSGLLAAIEKAEKREEAPVKRDSPAFMKAALDLRKGLYDVGEFARVLMQVAYLVFSAEAESQQEGDDSPVPAKLREAWGTLAAAFKAMTDEELEEMSARVNDSTLARAATIALTDLKKVEGADAEALSGAVQPLVTKGVTLVDPARDERLAKAEAEAASAVAAVETLKADNAAALASVEALKTDNVTLLTKLAETNKGLEALQDRVLKLAAEPLPAKTAGSVHATPVEKGADPLDSFSMSRGDLERALGAFAALPEQDRNHLLMRGALARPRAVNIDPAFSRSA